MQKFIAAAILLAAALTVRANFGGPEWSGVLASGSFRAMGTSQVEIQREILTIDLYRSRARVRVEYDFHNAGEAVDVKGGFPSFGVSGDPDYEPGIKPLSEVEEYQLTAGGEPVPFKREKGDPKPYAQFYKGKAQDLMGTDEDACRQCTLSWFVSTIHFDKGETKHVVVTYESPYFDSMYPGPITDYPPDYFRYLLSTARVWKGPIQQGRVTVNLISVEKDPVITPKNRFQKSGKSFVWEFSNFTPSVADDIQISLDNGFTSPSLANEDHEFPGDYILAGDKVFFVLTKFKLTASSSKPGYPVANAQDWESKTAWCAATPGGIGESLTITLPTPQRFDQVGIEPGYAKSKTIYFANNRIRELAISVNGGPAVTATFPDEYVEFDATTPKAYNWVDLPSKDGVKTVTLTIRAVYPGSKDNDTCVSSVRLGKHLPKMPPIHGSR